jgi:hypothetical protein
MIEAPQVINTREKIIPREPKHNVHLRRSSVPLFVSLTLINIFMVLVFIALGAMIILSLNVIDANISGIIVILTCMAVVVLVLVNLISYVQYASVHFWLVPGYIHTMDDGAVMDQIPGKIVIKRGTLNITESIVRLDEYERIRIEKSFLGNMFGYGTIHLLQTDQLQNLKDRPIQFVSDVEMAGNLIQRMIDMEITPSRPIPQN